ncbi:uncharacterized protein [Rutidosis leptorrhynchoides]|uniref:uncharacterized protein n=1 Tax=Rutidosis leptorrhynchoides TaxID=125765 RepID=UPI003A98E407
MTALKKLKEVQSLTDEAESAFQEMKKLLATLPTLTAPIDGEILYLYVSIANEAFGSVLVVEHEKMQKPIYFVSNALTGSEINYAQMENFVYALLLTSKRLRSLLPRTSVKGHVLVDYLAEMIEGAGAGLVLTSPSGEEHTYVLRFNFDVTNNETEYVALLAGLNIAHKMQITKSRTYVDPQLVSYKFNGSFDAHELSMQKYLQLLKEAAGKFEHFELAQVLRS